MAVTGDDRIGSGRQSALENPVIGLILVYEIHRLRRMNEDCEVVDRSLRHVGVVEDPRHTTGRRDTPGSRAPRQLRSTRLSELGPRHSV